MTERRCKNKKCQRILPEGYKHKYCENCRNERVQKTKTAVKGAVGIIATAGTVALAVVTKGKINPGDKA